MDIVQSLTQFDFAGSPMRLMSYPIGAGGGALAAWYFQDAIRDARNRYPWVIPLMGAFSGIGAVYVIYGSPRSL